MSNEEQLIDRRLTDQPFLYAFEDNALTLGASYSLLQVQTNKSGGEFCLRRIAGASDFCTSYRVQRPDSHTYFSNKFMAATREWPFAPETIYQPGDTILFDANVIDNTQQLLFQGVRRYKQRINPLPGPPVTYGKYFERAYQYVANYELAIPDGTPALSVFAQINIEVRNAPFVLRRVMIVDTETGGVPGGEASLVFTDANQQNLSNVPIRDYFFTYNQQLQVNLFPVPELIYPIGSLISVKAYNSFVGDEISGLSQQIIFDGAWLLPC